MDLMSALVGGNQSGNQLQDLLSSALSAGGQQRAPQGQLPADVMGQDMGLPQPNYGAYYANAYSNATHAGLPFGQVGAPAQIGADESYLDRIKKNMDVVNEVRKSRTNAAMSQMSMQMLQQALAGGGEDQQPPQGAPAQPQADSEGDPISRYSINPHAKIGGLPAQFYTAQALVSGKDPVEAAQKTQALLKEDAMRRAAPLLSTLDTAMHAADPVSVLSASPEAAHAVVYDARGLGLTQADFSDPKKQDAVRQAIAFTRNRLAGVSGHPTAEPPAIWDEVPGNLGSTLQRNRITGETKPSQPQQALEKLWDPNAGHVVYKLAGDLVRGAAPRAGGPVQQAPGPGPAVPGGPSGLMPYSDSYHATTAEKMAMAKRIATYDSPPLTGQGGGAAGERADGPEIMGMVEDILRKSGQPEYDSLKYGLKKTALESFAPGGDNGKTVQALATARQHIAELKDIAKSTPSGSLPPVNLVRNFMGRWTGNTNVTDLEAVKPLVADEITKAVLGGPGALSDREEVAHNLAGLANAHTPAQIVSVLSHMERFMDDREASMRAQYKSATGLKDYDKRVVGPIQEEIQAMAARRAKAAGILSTSTGIPLARPN